MTASTNSKSEDTERTSDKTEDIKEIKDEDIDNITKYFIVNKKSEKTHLLVDNYNNGLDKTNQNILNEIFSNEEKFPFLEKIYDSKENGYEYHVKLFKINYKIFENGI